MNIKLNQNFSKTGIFLKLFLAYLVPNSLRKAYIRPTLSICHASTFGNVCNAGIILYRSDYYTVCLFLTFNDSVFLRIFLKSLEVDKKHGSRCGVFDSKACPDHVAS